MTAHKRHILAAAAVLYGIATVPGAAFVAPPRPVVAAAGKSLITAAIPRPKPRERDAVAAIIDGAAPRPRVKPDRTARPEKQIRETPGEPERTFKAAPAKRPVRPLAAIGGPIASDAVPAVSGKLKDALAALQKNEFRLAIGIRNGMRPSLDRRIIDWQLARSGARDISSAFIARFLADAPGWPDGKLLRVRAERALLREKPEASSVLKAFAGTEPASTEGAILLARAHIAKGNPEQAARLIRTVWRGKRLSKSMQVVIIGEFGKLLHRADHKARADAMLYHERINDAQRLERFLTKAERALFAARSAVIRRKRNAGRLLKAVPASLHRDPGYQFARIQYLRRSNEWSAAAKLLLAAPRDQSVLIDPDEWWVERRLVSRKMLDLGKARTAYEIAAGHSARSAAKQAEAEFHAGWYALRYMRDPARARPHFQNILKIGKTAITRSRGYYWLGRTDEARGNKSAAQSHYQKAAEYGSTFYGQLARARLGKSTVGLGRMPRPGKADRTAFANNDLVKAIKALAADGHVHRTLPIFLHLSKTLPTPEQAALLIDLAESYGKHRFALIVGKRAARRWNDAAALAFPLNAIPRKTKIKRGVEKPMVYAIARQESAFDPAAVSHAGARGLLQLMPATAKATARRNGLSYSKKKLTTDAAYNATLGAAHLGELVNEFNGSYIMTFAGYNAGSRRVAQWIARYGDPRSRTVDAVDWIERIPFTETRNYVQRITENLQVYRARLEGTGLRIEKDLRRGGK